MRIGSLERAAYAAGFALLCVWLAVTVGGRSQARQAVAAFETDLAVDKSDWSPQRVAAYAAAAPAPTTPPLAILRIPRLKLTVPVLEGTDEHLLNRGVGHIPETAGPGEDGNIAIAGHRDGFFRSLKDVEAGDTIELETPGAQVRYVVERTWIVDPEDVWVLNPTDAPSITLVTCYPFYFVGSAPRRFIVRGVRSEDHATGPAGLATRN